MSDSPYPSQTQDKFVLRLPDGMRDRIKAAAEANNRSMNAEIVERLTSSFDKDFSSYDERMSYSIGGANYLLSLLANLLEGDDRTALQRAASVLSHSNLGRLIDALRSARPDNFPPLDGSRGDTAPKP